MSHEARTLALALALIIVSCVTVVQCHARKVADERAEKVLSAAAKDAETVAFYLGERDKANAHADEEVAKHAECVKRLAEIENPPPVQDQVTAPSPTPAAEVPTAPGSPETMPTTDPGGQP